MKFDLRTGKPLNISVTFCVKQEKITNSGGVK